MVENGLHPTFVALTLNPSPRTGYCLYTSHKELYLAPLAPRNRGELDFKVPQNIPGGTLREVGI
jgi:hypothetical protein